MDDVDMDMNGTQDMELDENKDDIKNDNEDDNNYKLTMLHMNNLHLNAITSMKVMRIAANSKVFLTKKLGWSNGDAYSFSSILGNLKK